MSQPLAYPPSPRPAGSVQTAAQRGRGAVRSGIRFAAGYVLVIWAVHLINVLAFGGYLVFFGINPLDVSSVWHILTSPLLHANIEHLVSNTVPGAIFSFLIGMSRARVWWEVTAFVVVVGGVGVWFFGGVGTNHIGASGLVYGWLAYLLVRGVFNRHFLQLVLGVILGIAYAGLVIGLLPGVPGVSWQAHLFGAVGGVAAGMFITSDDPPALRAKRRQRSLEQGGRRTRRGLR